MCEKDLLKTYQTHIRPVVEVNSVVIHSMLSAEQSESLERQQSMALSIIYGPGLSAAKMRAKAGIERLQDRRRSACESFVRKALNSERFKDWFQERPVPVYGRRDNKRYNRYVEENARTDRRRNSPKFFLRRLANEIC